MPMLIGQHTTEKQMWEYWNPLMAANEETNGGHCPVCDTKSEGNIFCTTHREKYYQWARDNEEKIADPDSLVHYARYEQGFPTRQWLMQWLS